MKVTSFTAVCSFVAPKDEERAQIKITDPEAGRDTVCIPCITTDDALKLLEALDRHALVTAEFPRSRAGA